MELLARDEPEATMTETAAEPVDPRGLMALAAIIEGGSVASAAARLSWSGPTVDHHVRKLERRVGAVLVERGPRGSRPTEAGRLVAARGAELLALGARLVDDVAAWRRGHVVPVRIGALPTMGARLLPLVHERLAREAAGAAFEVTLDEFDQLVAGLRRGELDAAVLPTMEGHGLGLGDAVTAEHLFTERVWLCLAADHPLAGADAAPPLRALRHERWAFGVDDDDPLDASTRALSRLEGVEPLTAMRSNDYPAVLRMVAAGLVVAIVPDSVLESPPKGVRTFPIDPAMLRRDVLLAVRRPAAPPAPSRPVGPGSHGDDPAARHAAAVRRVVAEVRAVAAQLAPPAPA